MKFILTLGTVCAIRFSNGMAGDEDLSDVSKSYAEYKEHEFDLAQKNWSELPSCSKFLDADGKFKTNAGEVIPLNPDLSNQNTANCKGSTTAESYSWPTVNTA